MNFAKFAIIATVIATTSLPAFAQDSSKVTADTVTVEQITGGATISRLNGFQVYLGNGYSIHADQAVVLTAGKDSLPVYHLNAAYITDDTGRNKPICLHNAEVSVPETGKPIVTSDEAQIYLNSGQAGSLGIK